MDLSAFSPVDSVDVTIYHPAFKEGEEPVFTIAGPCHPATKKAEKTRSEAIMKSRGRFDSEKAGAETLAARVLSWKNVTYQGEALECTPENAFMLFSKPGLKFIREQIYQALADNESFFKA